MNEQLEMGLGSHYKVKVVIEFELPAFATSSLNAQKAVEDRLPPGAKYRVLSVIRDGAEVQVLAELKPDDKTPPPRGGPPRGPTPGTPTIDQPIFTNAVAA